MKNTAKKMAACVCSVALAAASVSSIPVYAATTSSTSSTASSQSKSTTVKYGKVTSVSGKKIKLALGEMTAPEKPSGDSSNGSQGGTPPEMPSGTSSGTAQGGTPPEMPSGTSSGMAQGGTPPDMQSGGMMGTFTASGKTLTITISDESIIKKNGKTATISDINTDDILMLEYNSSGKLSAVNILDTSSMQGNMGGGSQSSSITLSAKYSADNTTKSVTSQKITQSAADSSALLATNGGTFKITSTKLYKTGDSSSEENSNFYGLNAVVAVQKASSAIIKNSYIYSNAEGSNGIFATGENAKITVSGTTIYTKGNSSRGLDATYGGTITASDMKITTLGAHCAPVATDRGGGTITVSSSKLNASGDGSPCIYSTGDITAKSCTGTATGSQIAVVEGKNSITLTSCTLTGAGKNGIMLYQSTSGDAAQGTATFTSTSSKLKTTSDGAMFYITNTDAVINLKKTTLTFSSGILLDAAGNSTNNWGTSGSNGGNVTLNATSQTLKGNITCDNISSVTVNLKTSSALTGAVDTANKGDVAVTLDKTSKWNVTADSYVTFITDADSTLSNIVSNGHTIYYSKENSKNSWLNGKTVKLSDGGKLVPVD